MTESDYTPDLVRVAQAVIPELMTRLTVDLSEKDGLAVAAAINKAVLRGVHIGVSACERELRARGFELPAVAIVGLDDQEEPEPDLWAEEYGGEDDE